MPLRTIYFKPSVETGNFLYKNNISLAGLPISFFLTPALPKNKIKHFHMTDFLIFMFLGKSSDQVPAAWRMKEGAELPFHIIMQFNDGGNAIPCGPLV